MSRRYGPHDPGCAPLVTVLGPYKWPQPEEVPLPEALLRQREVINQIAYERGLREEQS